MALGRYLFCLALTALPILAQEGGGEGEKPDMMIWKWLNFAILAGLIGFFAVKVGGPAFAKNARDIQEGLAAGERAKAEADARAREVEAKIATLGTEVASLRAAALAERDREASRIYQEFEREIDRIRYQADMEIEASGKTAKLELQSHAAKLAVELAEKKIRARMTPELQTSLIQGFVADFHKSAAAENGSRA